MGPCTMHPHMGPVLMHSSSCWLFSCGKQAGKGREGKGRKGRGGVSVKGLNQHMHGLKQAGRGGARWGERPGARGHFMGPCTMHPHAPTHGTVHPHMGTCTHTWGHAPPMGPCTHTSRMGPCTLAQMGPYTHHNTFDPAVCAA